MAGDLFAACGVSSWLVFYSGHKKAMLFRKPKLVARFPQTVDTESQGQAFHEQDDRSLSAGQSQGLVTREARCSTPA